MFAGSATPVPAESEGINLVRHSLAPGCDGTGTGLGAGSIQGLHPLSRGSHGTGKGLGSRHHPVRNFGTPGSKVLSHFHADGRILEATHLTDEAGEGGRKPPSFSTPDHPQGGALRLVGAFVKEEAHGGLRLSAPDVSRKNADGEHIQIVKRDITVAALADVVGKYTFAIARTGRLCEGAGARDQAVTNVEPISRNAPFRYFCHRAPLAVRG